ncbi:MAG: hypothetical protein WAT71_18335 [Ignavibacteria bacterium]
MKFILILVITLFSINISSQENIRSILDLTLSYRGLDNNDITIPINFDKEKSPTNNSKLLLPAVKELMQTPMNSFEFAGKISSLSNLEIDVLFKNLIEIKIGSQSSAKYNDGNIKLTSPEDLFNSLVKFCKLKKDQSLKTANKFSKEERDFLSKNLFSLISDGESEDEGNTNSDIFKFNQARDSSITVSKRTMDILSEKYSDEVLDNSVSDFKFCYSLFLVIQKSISDFNSVETEFLNNKNVNGDLLFYYDENNIRIAIGGKGNNHYYGHFDLIIDLGGDDTYDMFKSDKKNLFNENFSCIIDLSGTDLYYSKENFTLAGSAFSNSFIFDNEGDDTYRGKNVSLGSAIFGAGILCDFSGNDIYQGDKFSIGAGSFGYGILFDVNGNDVYTANSYSQGFGMTEGIGVISDQKGNDSYLIDARSLDIGRYEDHYVSMSQGYGLGLRPYYAGGIGLIIEGEGNDIYNTDIFGQGGAYWYGLGCISDNLGNDKYNSYQYAQGAGIHLAVGILNDKNGWDFYSSNGVSQGCGHDYGVGFLYDENGNDNYSAFSLSQGAGNANGIGIFIDEKGRDGYLNKEPGNSRGYGNSRREFGSLGIFLDASGDDFYSEMSDSLISNTSMWGVMLDYYLKEENYTPSGSNYKVVLDSIKKYSIEEYFIMAKTIEPRFSLWQEFGFRHLVNDSDQTSKYILKYLDTDDHRSGLVLRNLAFKIGYSMGNVFNEKLNLFNNSKQPQEIFNENEVAYICYLFGETGNASGKDEILGLTYSDNNRIKTVAVNALGKIKYDTSDVSFKDKVINRLSKMVMEINNSKILTKDLAYAFGNYKSENNIPALITLLSSDYFGARFIAAKELTSYGDEYFEYLNESDISDLSQKSTSFHALLNSTTNISLNNFEELIKNVSSKGIFYDDGIQIYFIDIVNKRISNTKDEQVSKWLRDLADSFQKNFPLKTQ